MSLPFIFGRRKKAALRRLAEGWGKGEPASVDSDTLECAAAFYQELSKDQPPVCPVDDITWNDLDMNAVFAALNYAHSTPGEELLYAALRDAGQPDQALAARQSRVRALSECPASRSQMSYELNRLGRNPYHNALLHLFRPTGKRPDHGVIYWILGLMPLVFLLSGIFWPPLFLGMVVMFIINAIVYYVSTNRWLGEVNAVRHIAAVLSTAKRLMKELPPQLADERRELQALTRELKPVARWNGLFVMQKQDPMDFITDYVRLFFQLDMICLDRLTLFFAAHHSTLKRLYLLVGELDVCLSIAEYRASGAVVCDPEFASDTAVQAVGLAHPLLRHPVRNNILWQKNILITGSNASGKSTFLKALAINAILAQTLSFCTAERFSMPRAGVMTSMALRDNVQDGESYFIVEIRSLLRILNAMNSVRPTLCFIDEILRGTNTRERIAASAALLAYLKDQNGLCMAATHDLELTRMLADYRQVHFREELTDAGMSFTYKLLDGPSDTCNAIALLRQMKFPPQVLKSADRYLEEV